MGSGGKKKRVRIADGPDGVGQPAPLRKKPKVSKGKGKGKKTNTTKNSGRTSARDSHEELPHAGSSGASNVKEEGAGDGAEPLGSAGATAPKSPARGLASSRADDDVSAAGGAEIKPELLTSASAIGAGSPYAGPRTRSRTRRLVS